MRPARLVFAALLLGAFGACREPTEIRLVLTSDACSAIEAPGVTIAAGNTLAGLSRVPQASNPTCENAAVDDVGSIVLVPSGDPPAAVAVEVVLHRSAASGCPEGCIVARRALRYVPHMRLLLPIALSARCAGIGCAAA